MVDLELVFTIFLICKVFLYPNKLISIIIYQKINLINCYY